MLRRARRIITDFQARALKPVLWLLDGGAVSSTISKTVTVRDLRQRWPEAEKALQTEDEILITRDSIPVAKLVRYVGPPKARKRFDPAAHGAWQRKVSGGKTTRWVKEGLLRERNER